MLAAGGRWVHAAEITHAIVVRTYTHPDWAEDLRAARRTAGAILGGANIEVTWLECGLPSGVSEAANRCADSLRANELVVRILPAGSRDSRPHVDALGFALVDLDAGGGSLATVYADRVRLMARGARADAAELLGRTIAHEIGHLLLGTNQHGRGGLMRASWTGADLRRNLPLHWLFGSKEAHTMRSTLSARLAR
jgi:hypothetical protein